MYDDPDLSDLTFIKKIIKKDVYLYVNNKPRRAFEKSAIKSNGEFLAFIDSDDIWKKQKLNKQIQFMKNQPTASLPLGIINSFGKIIDLDRKKKITFKDLTFSCDIGLSTVILKNKKKLKIK